MARTAAKTATKKSKVVPTYEPERVFLMISITAVLSIVLFAYLGTF